MSSTTPQTDSVMRRADSMMPNAVVVSAPTARGLESALNEARCEIERLRTLARDASEAWEHDSDIRLGKLLSLMLDEKFSEKQGPDLTPNVELCGARSASERA